MEELQVFNYENNEVRTSYIDDQIYFVGKDVCRLFGDTNHKRSLSRLSDEDKTISKIMTNGGLQEVTLINESGLYSLLFSMQPKKGIKGDTQITPPLQERLDKLENFKHWVTKEVLPSIRKNGGYIVNQEKMGDEELLAQSVLVAQRIIENKNKQIAEQQKQMEQMQKKVKYADVILNCKTTIDVTTIAQDYGMSAYAFNLKLKELGIQHKIGKTWIINREYLDGGYVKSETIEIPHTYPTKVKTYTKWTQRGRMFLYEKLKENGLLPLIEREVK